MKHKYFSVKDLKESIENPIESVPQAFIEISLEMVRNIVASKKPAPKKGPAFFSYKGINLN